MTNAMTIQEFTDQMQITDEQKEFNIALLCFLCDIGPDEPAFIDLPLTEDDIIVWGEDTCESS